LYKRDAAVSCNNAGVFKVSTFNGCKEKKFLRLTPVATVTKIWALLNKIGYNWGLYRSYGSNSFIMSHVNYEQETTAELLMTRIYKYKNIH